MYREQENLQLYGTLIFNMWHSCESKQVLKRRVRELSSPNLGREIPTPLAALKLVFLFDNCVRMGTLWMCMGFSSVLIVLTEILF